MNQVYSNFYIYDNNQYKFVAKVSTFIESQNIITNLEYNGKTITETQVLLPDYQPNSIISPYASFDGMPVTGWTYWGTFYYSYHFVAYTLDVVQAAVSAIVGASSLGIGGAVVVGATSAIVSRIIESKIPNLYYTSIVYYKAVIPPESWMTAIKVAEKNYFKFYEDSSRIKYIGSSTSYHYRDGYIE